MRLKGCLTSLVQVTFFINSSVMEQCVQVLTLGDVYVLYNIICPDVKYEELIIYLCPDVDDAGCLCPDVHNG